MTQDIRRYGDDQAGLYWIKVGSGFGVGKLRPLKIDRLSGKSHLLRGERPWDDAAPTKAEALDHFFADDYKAADKQLEEWKKTRPEPPPEPEPPVDLATERWELGL